MNTTDLRVIKTQENIQQAFWELLQEKSINRISVKEICDRARCSRNTFYTHYPYKEALVESITDELISKLLYGFAPFAHFVQTIPNDLIDYAGSMLQSIYENADRITVIINSTLEDIFLEKLSLALFEQSINFNKSINYTKKQLSEVQLIAKYYIHGFVAFAIQFLKQSDIDFETAKNILSILIQSGNNYVESFFLNKKAKK